MSDVDALVFRLNFATYEKLEGNSYELQADALEIHVKDMQVEIQQLRHVAELEKKRQARNAT